MRSALAAPAFAMLALAAAAAPCAADAFSFWEQPRRGANCQNRRVTPEYWRDARNAGLEWIRLVPDGWKASGRDFLIGNADAFDTLAKADLDTLRRVLDDAHAAGVRVTLTMFSLPGARWRQLNGDRDDPRLWKDPRFRPQAAAFWRQLAAALRGHPAIVAYNPLNEPHPERALGLGDADSAAFAAWHRAHRGTPADLNAFNREIVAAIRASDRETPILLDGWMYASALGLTFLEPVDDARTLYAFHSWDPWEYTTLRVNRRRYSYPGRMPPGWTPDRPDRLAAGVEAWAARHRIPRTRIVAAEFGVDRRVGGAREFLADAVARWERHGWHWAFYSFRPDSWDGLDYELGTAPMGAAYWNAVEAGKDGESLKRRGPNPLWEVLSSRLRPRR